MICRWATVLDNLKAPFLFKISLWWPRGSWHFSRVSLAIFKALYYLLFSWGCPDIKSCIPQLLLALLYQQLLLQLHPHKLLLLPWLFWMFQNFLLPCSDTVFSNELLHSASCVVCRGQYLVFLPSCIHELWVFTAIFSKHFVVVSEYKQEHWWWKETRLDFLKILSSGSLVREEMFILLLISPVFCCPYFPPCKNSDSKVNITSKIS